MSSKRASVIPLAGFLKPQSPAERLAAQHRDREKLQREMQLKELQEEEAKAYFIGILYIHRVYL